MELYYFSGTGNCLYLANQLKERIPEINLQPIVSLLEFETIIPKSKIIGLCFPNHAGHLPIPMKIFIKKLHLTGDEYLFAICNSAFSKSFANEDINKIISQKGCCLSSYFNITMPDNHSFVAKDYAPSDKKTFQRFEYRAQKKLILLKILF